MWYLQLKHIRQLDFKILLKYDYVPLHILYLIHFPQFPLKPLTYSLRQSKINRESSRHCIKNKNY